MSDQAAKTPGGITTSPFLDRAGAFVERRPELLRALGSLETRLARRRVAGLTVDRPIYVAGLARAGSTILLELLAEHPDTATHRYRDYPFVHVPLWWNSFLDRAGRMSTEAVERFHRDRIRVTAESPEAMEEILWMSFFPNAHDPGRSNVLGAGTANPEFERFYRDHVLKLLALRRGRRYLAKGNYNVTRLGYLGRMFPDARFVVPVREPAGHVASLMKQHRILSEEERRDGRVLAYMRRAGHFEFGLDRRPIHTGDDAVAARIRSLWERGEEVRGWALSWSAIYAHVADVIGGDAALAGRIAVVHYDDLCAAPRETLERVYRHVGLPVDAAWLERQGARLSAPGYYRADFSAADLAAIREETAEVHERVRALARRVET